MATIYFVKRPSGERVIRMVIRRKGVPSFCLTFDYWEDACNWAKQHEEEYIKDPEKFRKWRDEYNWDRRMGIGRSKELMKWRRIMKPQNKIQITKAPEHE